MPSRHRPRRSPPSSGAAPAASDPSAPQANSDRRRGTVNALYEPPSAGDYRRTSHSQGEVDDATSATPRVASLRMVRAGDGRDVAMKGVAFATLRDAQGRETPEDLVARGFTRRQMLRV